MGFVTPSQSGEIDHDITPPLALYPPPNRKARGAFWPGNKLFTGGWFEGALILGGP